MSKKKPVYKLNLEVMKDPTGKFRTQSLFYETNVTHYESIFTLKEDDIVRKGLYLFSLKKMYLEIADPTEYLFAKQIFGTYAQWKRLYGNKQFDYHIDAWREELELKLMATGIQEQIKAAKNGNINSARWLSEKGWDKRRGRPSKEEIAKNKKQSSMIEELYKDDLERLGVSN